MLQPQQCFLQAVLCGVRTNTSGFRRFCPFIAVSARRDSVCVLRYPSMHAVLPISCVCACVCLFACHQLRGQDWGKVQLSQPFVFDGSEWLKGTEDLGLWRQIVAWYFDLHRLLTLPLHPKIAHQHEYSAALSLMSGFYKYAGSARAQCQSFVHFKRRGGE